MLKKNYLGNTDIVMSCIGLGTVKFGRNQQVKYPHEFELPTDKEIHELLETAQQLGINFLDTAPAYGHSEERLGEMLKGRRKDWVICSKVGEEFIQGASYFDFSAQAIRHSIERSLKRLHTDYLDIILVHSNGEDEKIIASGVFASLAECKQAGLIRAFGMSTKTVKGGLLTIAQADVAMVTYNPIQTEEKIVIENAHKLNKGILIKKALVSGHLQNLPGDDPVRTAMKFIFNTAGITSIVVGTLNKEHLEYNVHCALDVG